MKIGIIWKPYKHSESSQNYILVDFQKFLGGALGREKRTIPISSDPPPPQTLKQNNKIKVDFFAFFIHIPIEPECSEMY